MQRPMLPAERELMLSIAATCFAINERTKLSANFQHSGVSGLLYVKLFDHDQLKYDNCDLSHPHSGWVSFTELYPDNTTSLTIILNHLLSLLPGTEALVLHLPVIDQQAA